MVVPGAVTSGLKRPSTVGPTEEKYARLSNLAAPRIQASILCFPHHILLLGPSF